MRFLRTLLAAALASTWPAPATAAVAAVRAVPPAGMSSVSLRSPRSISADIRLAPLPAPLAPTLPAPALAGSLLAAPPVAQTAAPVASPSSQERLTAAAAAVAAASRPSSPVPAESSASAAEEQFRLLLGATAARPRSAAYAGISSAPDRSSLAPAKRPLNADQAKRVRGMFAGTAVMKIGMETVTLSIPLLTLQALGGATLVAGLVIVYGLAQAAFAGAAGSLLDRLPAQRVLGGAVISQALLVSSVIALGVMGLLSPLTLFPLYMLIGGAAGIAETARHSIPPLILGHDEEALSRYNARLHIFYEVAGVTGALMTGALITFVGPLWALALQPPAYLLGGLLFWRVKLAEKQTLKVGFAKPVFSGARERIAEYFRDLKAGAELVLKNDRLRWVAVAFVLPQIAHRILEGMLAPIFAKRVLMDPGSAGYLMSASNLGELIGAVLLLRFAAKIKAPGWVKWCALAMILSWIMLFTHALPFVLPVFLFMSMTWSASDLSLRSEIQSSLDKKDQPRATSFLFSAFVLGAAVASLALGSLFDHLPIALSLAGVFALFTALGVAVFHASRRLSAQKAE